MSAEKAFKNFPEPLPLSIILNFLNISTRSFAFGLDEILSGHIGQCAQVPIDAMNNVVLMLC